MFYKPSLARHYARLSIRKLGFISLTLLLPISLIYYACVALAGDGYNYIHIQLPRIDYNNSFELPIDRRYSNRQIILVTPTFARSDRPADILATAYALMSVPNHFWLLVEDNNTTAKVIRKALEDKPIKYAYIAHPNGGLPCNGWSQYNRAFEYIKENRARFDPNAVVYLANDNDAYGLDLFEQYVRPVKKIGVWPVGLTNYLLQLPKVKNGKVVEFERTLKGAAHLGVYFGGFAFHISYLLSNEVKLTTDCAGLYGEECLLRQLNISMEDYEPYGISSSKQNVQIWRRTTPTIFNRNFPKFGYLTDTVPAYEPIRFEMCEKFRSIYKMTKSEAEEAAMMIHQTWDPAVRIPPLQPVKDIYYISGRDKFSL